jgi:hypothetical protein
MVRLRSQGENGRGGWQYLIETLRLVETIRLNAQDLRPCPENATMAGTLTGLQAQRRLIVE